jgi:hypothetical protein
VDLDPTLLARPADAGVATDLRGALGAEDGGDDAV